MGIGVATEKALGLVVRGTDYSETSRIATLWTREWGKIHVLAKGARRPKSNFESALDLLSLCSIVLIRKTSGGLDLLTEARVEQRFAGLRRDLSALYAGYYIAELLSDLTEDHDPHPGLFDASVAILERLGLPGGTTPGWLMAWESRLLRELGYAPLWTECAGCREPLAAAATMTYSAAAGGMICGRCRVTPRGQVRIMEATWMALRKWMAWEAIEPIQEAMNVMREMRGVFNETITYLLGRRPRLMAYLGSES